MMDKDIRAAFDAVRPSDELRNDILNMAEEEKPAAKRSIRPVLYRVAALAATLAIILTAALWPRQPDDGFVTAPGVLKVYGYDLSTGSSIQDMETRELEGEIVESLSLWFQGMSSLGGVPLKFEVDDDALGGMDITFHIKANCGEFHGDYMLDKYKENPEDKIGTAASTFLGDDFFIENGETVEWSYFPTRHDWEGAEERDGGIFADVIIRADDHIIGYAVVRMVKVPDTVFYAATRLACEYYPMVDGEFQEITEEYIDQQIANAKQKVNKSE